MKQYAPVLEGDNMMEYTHVLAIDSVDDVSFEILDPDGDPICRVNSPIDANDLVDHLNHPRGEYTVFENPGAKILRFAIMDSDEDTIAFVELRETADSLLTHLNRKN